MDENAMARLAARVDKVEEACAFGERAVEELSEEVRLLNERVREALKRVEGLERRLEGVLHRLSDGGSGEGIAQ